MLTAVGASPRECRTLAAAGAAILTLLGGVLAVPAGLLPIWCLSIASDSGPASERIVSGASIVAVVVLVPAVAAWALTCPGATTVSLAVP